MSGYGAAFGLWRAASPDWDAYTRHAFVEGLRDGSLPRAAFLHYLAQDYVFLKHFSRAWGLAIAKADTLDEMEAAAATVHGLLHHEMGLHVEICGAAGISEAELRATPEAPGNMAYTRYVLEAGYSGDFLDLLAALAPCVLGYGEIGQRLAQDHAPDYADWIATYGGAEYQGICESVGTLIDGALTHRLGPDYKDLPRFAQLGTRFAQATTLEVGFWDMGLAPE
ncbi:thiaminase II [Dinoroseobacter sp. S76]|uniref:thiaminase II n=1 Tax=Dinoroseobacter sp. S76 TaxID=3415124 RepID=UPI003C7AA951